MRSSDFRIFNVHSENARVIPLHVIRRIDTRYILICTCIFVSSATTGNYSRINSVRFIENHQQTHERDASQTYSNSSQPKTCLTMTRRVLNPSVRRQLFPTDENQNQAMRDNQTNILKEIYKIDRLRMIKTWNFDSKNDRQFFEDGPIEWFRKDGNTWTGKVQEEEAMVMKEKNEETPKPSKGGGNVPPVRKRARSEGSGGSDGTEKVKRRITF